jgi:hypothetical protein
VESKGERRQRQMRRDSYAWAVERV